MLSMFRLFFTSFVVIRNNIAILLLWPRYHYLAVEWHKFPPLRVCLVWYLSTAITFEFVSNRFCQAIKILLHNIRAANSNTLMNESCLQIRRGYGAAERTIAISYCQK